MGGEDWIVVMSWKGRLLHWFAMCGRESTERISVYDTNREQAYTYVYILVIESQYVVLHSLAVIVSTGSNGKQG